MFTEFDLIVLVWLLPVTVFIVLPLIMFVVHTCFKGGKSLLAASRKAPETVVSEESQTA